MIIIVIELIEYNIIINGFMFNYYKNSKYNGIKRHTGKASVLTLIIILPTLYGCSHIFPWTGLLHFTRKFSCNLMNQPY